ncbi:hypothetical protein HY256_09490 [Candidatus Sumerlaeota bacterium]|nr:hypothetical protein [Candidatus Sumerlaeota bacterium]
MERERFEELLMAELDGELEVAARADLDAACAADPALRRARDADLQSVNLLRSVGAHHAPVALAADVLNRIEREMLAAEEAAVEDREEFQDDDFNSRMTRKRSESRRAAAPPAWLSIFASPFLRFGFALGVLGIIGYMGLVIVRQSNESGRPLIPFFDRKGVGGGNLAVTDSAPKEIEIASVRAPARADTAKGAEAKGESTPAVDVEALASLPPAPAAAPKPESEIASAEGDAEQSSEDASVTEGDSDAENMDADQAESAEADGQEADETAGSPEIPELPPLSSAPPSAAKRAILTPKIESPEKERLAERAIASAPSVPEGTISAFSNGTPTKDAPSSKEHGMEEVFGRIREDLKNNESSPAVAPAKETKPSGAGGGIAQAQSVAPDDGLGGKKDARPQVVADVGELRAALERQKGAERAEPLRDAKMASANPPAVPSVKPAEEAPEKKGHEREIVTEVDELRAKLNGRRAEEPKARNEEKIAAARPATPEPPKAAIHPAVTAPPGEPADALGKIVAAAAPQPQKSAVQNGLQEGAARKSGGTNKVKQIEISVARQGGTIIKRAADPSDPSLIHITCRMTRTQIKNLQKDLERQGINAGKREKTQSGGAGYAIEQKNSPVGDEQPIEFEILVRSGN